jgi:hypothetical protein
LGTLTKNVLQTEGQSALEFDSLSAYLLFSLSEVGSRIDQFDDIGRRWMELMVIQTYFNQDILETLPTSDKIIM